MLAPAFAFGAEYENFRSEVKELRPAVRRLELAVVRGDEGLRLRNTSGRTVVVEGYDEEPYLRFKPGGAVEANQRSAATYINVDRFGLQEVPENALPGATPVWKRIGGGGEHTWFDHRIHLTAKRPPARFTRQKKLTKVFDWKVPMTVNGRDVLATGTLVWDPNASSAESDGFPVWAWVLIALALISVGVFLTARRARRRSSGPPGEEPAREAW